MRVFKHGDALAIVFPQSIAGASGIKEGEELEFVEIEKGLFVLARKEKLAEALKPRVEQAFSSPATASAQPRQQEQSGLAAFFKRELDSKGFVVVFAEKGAQEVSVALEKEFKSGAIRGTRGFDSKFYLAKRTFVEENSPKLLKQLQTPSSTEQLAEKTRLPEDAVKALLCILMEEGEVIEKKKGLFICA